MATQNTNWILSDDPDHSVHLDSCPFTPGTTIIQTKGASNCKSIFDLFFRDYIKTFMVAKKWASTLCEKLPVERCAMITVPINEQGPQIKLIPLHGLGPNWKPIIAEHLEFHEQYLGYCTSKNGPRASDESLVMIQNKIRNKLQTQSEYYDFYGDQKNDNLFAKIVKGEIEQWRIWEDKEHVAFLTPFPNVPGFTVLVPRKHLPSDIFSLDDVHYMKILQASYKVNSLLKQSLNVDDCAMIFEGYEIDYAHTKIIPIIRPYTNKTDQVANGYCGTNKGYATPFSIPGVSCYQYPVTKIIPIIRQTEEIGDQGATDYCSAYTGYVTSMNGPRASDQDLEKMMSILKV